MANEDRERNWNIGYGYDRDRGPQESYRGRGPKNYQRSDDRIREDICERLAMDHDVDASDIEVAVAEGVVTLNGTVSIDGETIDFLFDTGATNILPEEVLKQIGDGRPANRATSFLTRSTFEKWRSKHPEWRSFDNIRTLSGKAMIEVPRVTVGGFTVGPVWFTVQSDSAFHTYMAQWMDKQTEGALGGSLLHYLRVSVDWPNAAAVFEKP